MSVPFICSQAIIYSLGKGWREPRILRPAIRDVKRKAGRGFEVRLVRFRRGALTLAGWLLALETIGAVMLVMGGDYIAQGRFNPLLAPGVATIVILVWTAPNAFAFHKGRAKFIEAARANAAGAGK